MVKKFVKLKGDLTKFHEFFVICDFVRFPKLVGTPCTYIFFWEDLDTLFEIFIFCPKIQLWFPEKIVDFLGWKTHENVDVLDSFAVDKYQHKTENTISKTNRAIQKMSCS